MTFFSASQIDICVLQYKKPERIGRSDNSGCIKVNSETKEEHYLEYSYQLPFSFHYDLTVIPLLE